jgi:hypothetical protein
MVMHINSAATLDITGMYIEFINRLNTQIAYFNDHNHHPAPKNIQITRAAQRLDGGKISVEEYS